MVILAKRVFTGHEWLVDQQIHVHQGRIQEIKSVEGDLQGSGFICAGFIDLQVYGGGELLFSNHPTEASIAKTFEEHHKTGTTHFQITLNCSPKETMWRAIDSCQAYMAKGGKGLIGLHLEGPFFNPIRKGAHKEEYVQSPSVAYIQEIVQRAGDLPIYMTIAPEMFSEEALDYIIQSPITVSLGHSDATIDQANHALSKGANRITHLFNAMSQWQSRALGLVGASFSSEAWTSIIVDGLHCDFRSVKLAKELKKQRLFLITDAVTHDVSGPYLFDKKDGKFSNEAGTLSGSALTMEQAIQNCVYQVGMDVEEAIRMATLYPAQVANLEQDLGTVEVGKKACLIHMSDDLKVQQVWLDGEPLMD